MHSYRLGYADHKLGSPSFVLTYAGLQVVLGNLTSFAGFFTVDAVKASNMFFWYFPALNSDASAPLLIWLQGGPGASSMFSLFHEIGPYELSRSSKREGGKHSDITLGYRELSWNNRYNLLFVDNPVGSGFRFASLSVCVTARDNPLLPCLSVSPSLSLCLYLSVCMCVRVCAT